jgi:hypothetical protein
MGQERRFNVEADEKTTRERLIAGMTRLGYKQLTTTPPLRFQRGRMPTFSMSLKDAKTTATIDLTSSTATTTDVSVALKVPFGGNWPYYRRFWEKEIEVIEAIAQSRDEPSVQSFIDLGRNMTEKLLAASVVLAGILWVEWVLAMQIPTMAHRFTINLELPLVLILFTFIVANTMRHIRSEVSLPT